jgi:hypothetical protein
VIHTLKDPFPLPSERKINAGVKKKNRKEREKYKALLQTLITPFQFNT